MATTISRSYVLAQHPDTAYSDLTDPGYLTQKAVFLDHGDFEIVTNTAGMDGGVLTTRQRIRVQVPRFAAAMVPAVNTVTETQVWSAKDPDGARTCDLKVEIVGVPARVSGRLVLRPAAGGVQVDVTAAASTSLPLLAGRVERLVIADVEKIIVGEKEFGQQWILSQS